MTRPTDSSHMDMRTRILSCIDRKIEKLSELSSIPDAIRTERIAADSGIIHLSKLRQEIEAMQEQSQWIPVTEDMERKRAYLLYAKEWFYFTWFYDWASNNYMRDWSDWELVIATHYQILPLPPSP